MNPHEKGEIWSFTLSPSSVQYSPYRAKNQKFDLCVIRPIHLRAILPEIVKNVKNKKNNKIFVELLPLHLSVTSVRAASRPTCITDKNSSGDEIANVNFYAVRPKATRIRRNNA